VKYADDTVVYFASKDIHQIEKSLNEDFIRIANYLDENELVLNLKKGKTESLLFGTAKRINMAKASFEIKYKNDVVNNVTEYKYLGNFIDQSLTLHADFNKKYKKASCRIRLLSRLRPYLTGEATFKVFQTMIVPLLTYCNIANLNLTDSQIAKFRSIENRFSIILGYESEMKKLSIENQFKIKACLTVRKSVDNELCDVFNDYFQINNHGRTTRNECLLVTLPKTKLEFARRSFYFYGAKIYNSLPVSIRRENDFSCFRQKVNDYFNFN